MTWYKEQILHNRLRVGDEKIDAYVSRRSLFY